MLARAIRVTASIPLGAILALLLVAPGCRRFTPAAADREVGALLDRRRADVPEVAGSLRLSEADHRARVAREAETYELTLRDALALAATASRDYRRQREDVYLAALRLTGRRNEYRPLFDLGGSADVGLDADGASLSGGLDASLSRAFRNGGSLVLGLASDFLRNITTTNPVALAQSVIRADLSLPLARGSGWVAREELIQAERDTLYALRSYARFQQLFSVDIATRFYRVLQDQDTVRNEERTFANLQELLARQEALGAQQAGRLPDFQVDQTRQDVLRADDRRQQARTSLASSLDRFKLELGIPVRAAVTLRTDDLDALRARGPSTPEYDAEALIRTALGRRLDLRSARDQVEDARRKVCVARDGLGAQVDLRLGADLRGPADRPFDLEDVAPTGSFGLDVDLPFERTSERNAYRTALLQRDRAEREREGLEDQIVLEVREALRRLAQARRSYEIQREGVRLAERRVESTELLLEAGKASTRDRLDAEDSLVRASNALAQAMVDHAVARLGLARDVGTLLVDENAAWPEAPRPPGDGPLPEPVADAVPVPDSAPALQPLSPPPPPPPPPEPR